jgi:hypothetical protein
VPRCAGGDGLEPGYRVDAPHAEREDAGTSVCPASAPQRRAAIRPLIPNAHINHWGDEREVLWPGAGDAPHRRGGTPGQASNTWWARVSGACC